MKIEWIVDVPIPGTLMNVMQSAADRCLPCEGVNLPCCAMVQLCDDERIRKINREKRGIDRSTDVVSFPSVLYPKGKTAGSCEKLLRREYDDDSEAVFLGDIIISVPHILHQAHQYGHSAEREASYLLVHGLCHLMGYDHMNEEEKKQMRAMEEKILNASATEEKQHG